MKRIILGLIAIVALGTFIGQTQTTLPANTVMGRLGIGPGPSQAIPFATLAANLTGGGLDTNTLNARTAAYTLDTTDCGKTITLGGSAFYALTVNAASTYPATCSFAVVNIDTGRAKTMAVNGTTFPTAGLLWPGQSVIIKNNSNVWRMFGALDRWRVSSPITITVNTALGNDANDGFAAGTGNAMATLGAAISRVCSYFDVNALVTIQTTTGQTHPSQTLCNYIGNTQGGVNNPTIQGDTSSCANAANYTIDGGAAAGVVPVDVRSPWTIQGMRLTSSTNGTAINADFGSVLYLSTNVTFPTVTGFHVRSAFKSKVEFIGNYCVTGNAVVHWSAHGDILIQPGKTITFSNSPAFTFFIQAHKGGVATITSTTFTNGGTVTGADCELTLGGGIDTGGGGAAYLPGTVNCTATAPAWYN